MKRVASLCMASGLALAAGAAGAETVTRKERELSIRYRDGVVERYRIAWSAELAFTLRESGGSLVPYQGAVESRGCSWTAAGSIERTVAMATRLGPTVPLPAMNRTIRVDLERPDKSLAATTTVATSCREATATRERGLRDAAQALLAAFEGLAAADLESLRREAQSRSEVVQFIAE